MSEREVQGVELIWPGKTREVTSVVLPFQSIEQVDEPRAEEAQSGESMDLFSLAPGGRQQSGWTNKLIWGDNKLILSSLANGPLRREIEDAGGLKLVYIDPPFDVGADFSFSIALGDDEDQLTKEQNVIEELVYRDTWGKGQDSYLSMIYERLALIHSLLSPEASIFVHMGWQVSSAVRLVMDEIFGSERLRNELIWQRFNFHADANRFGTVHETILYYSKGAKPQFEKQYLPVSDSLIKSHYTGRDEDGRVYTLDNPTAPAHGKTGAPMKFGDKILNPPKGAMWRWKQENIDELWNAGKIVFNESGMPRVKRYLDETEGTAVHSIWTDVRAINSQAAERIDFATQKPEALLERIINASSNPGDLVADFFCGSGTTLAVAEKLGRKWIGCDLGRFAIHTTRKRMIGVQRELKAADKPYRAFEILNLGKYERQFFSGINPNLSEEEKLILAVQKEEQYLNLILSAYRAERVLQTPPFHGRQGQTMVVVGPLDAPVTQGLLHETLAACRRLKVSKADILGFDFEMGLMPYEVDKGREQGVSLALRYIPRDVFDKRAVEKGQVKFYDVAYVEVKATLDGQRVKLTLCDFGVYYRQDDEEGKLDKLKPGASKVIVKNGQVVKVTRQKPSGAGGSARDQNGGHGGPPHPEEAGAAARPTGEFSEEVLTKQWTDWIDYWAVDFDFFTRPEQVRIVENGAERSVYTGNYLFENEWQSFRTRKNRTLELSSAWHEYDLKGLKKSKKTIAIKVIDIFGNDTTKVVEVWVNAAP